MRLGTWILRKDRSSFLRLTLAPKLRRSANSTPAGSHLERQDTHILAYHVQQPTIEHTAMQRCAHMLHPRCRVTSRKREPSAMATGDADVLVAQRDRVRLWTLAHVERSICAHLGVHNPVSRIHVPFLGWHRPFDIAPLRTQRHRVLHRCASHRCDLRHRAPHRRAPQHRSPHRCAPSRRVAHKAGCTLRRIHHLQRSTSTTRAHTCQHHAVTPLTAA